MVQSLGYDGGHNEESRNGRDIKIDILDDYIRTSERFRVIRVFSEFRGVTGIHREKYWALLGHTGIEERDQKEGGAPPWSEFDKGCSPVFLLPLPLFPSLLLLKGKWNPTRTWES